MVHSLLKSSERKSMRDRFQDAKDTVGMIEIMIQNQLKQNDMMKQELDK